MESMESSLNRLRYNTLFEHFDDKEYELLSKKLQRHFYRKDDVILASGVQGDELYLLVDGRVKILHSTKVGEDIMLAFLHPGDFFGETELIDGRYRSSRVIAVDDCVVFSLTKLDFDDLLLKDLPFIVRLMQVLSIRLRALNQTFVAELQRNHAKATKEYNKLKQIIEATQVVNSTLELNDLLNIILETAVRLLDVERGTVYLIDEKRNELWSMIFKGPEQIKIKLQIGQGIAGYVAATGDTVNIPDAYLDHRFNPEVDKKSGYSTKTILCMPMKNREGKIIGVFQLLNKRTGIFNGEDEQLISAISIPASIAVENARLYAQEKQKIAMEKDLIAAMEVQRTLLPRTIPKPKDFRFAAKSLPAKNVAGDLYDFITIDDHRIAVCLGDVTGKGLPASLLMANAQATIRSSTFADVTPKQCMERSNTLLYNTISADKFVSLFYGIIDTEQHTISFSNAGQENPILISSGRIIYRLAVGGIPLGLMGDAQYEEETISMNKDDVIVIFSDGVTEAMNEKKELFGEEQLLTVINTFNDREPEEIIDKIMDSVNEHTGSTSQWDDITIMIIKCIGS